MLDQEGTCIPPGDREYRIEIYDGVRDPFDYHGRNPEDQDWMVCVVDTDPEGHWYHPPEWRRWPGGDWTHPLPCPKLSLSLFDIQYDSWAERTRDRGDVHDGPGSSTTPPAHDDGREDVG